MPMRIVLITGSYPPDVCGVGYYSRQLVEALRNQGAIVEVMGGENWSLLRLGTIFKKINSMRPDILHIQYPTAGYRYHLTPQVLSLIAPSVVTIHEVSQAHILRKVSLLPFSLRSRHVVFTTSFERTYSLAWTPWIAGKSSVIPIGNNLGMNSSDAERDLKEIVYFGLIRPNKGLEHILKLASLFKEHALPHTVRIIGSKRPGCGRYSEDLIRQSGSLPIIWDMDLPDSTTSHLLSRSRVAYLPYPDGASERRGTLLALLAHGVPTITTRGPHTPESLDGAVEFTDSPEAALPLIRHLLEDAVYCASLSKKARAFATDYSWENIARRHLELYRKLIGPPAP